MKLSKLICCIFSVINVYSQPSPSPIRPVSSSVVQHDIGAFIGLGQNFQSGDLYVKCEDCIFSGGTGFGFTFGLLYEYRFLKNFELGASLAYRYLGFSAGFQEISTSDHLYTDYGVINETVDLKYKHTAEVDLHNISISPYLKWTPFKFMFVRVGLGIGTNFSTNIKHTEELDQKTARLSNGEIVTIKNNSANQYVQNTDIPDLKSPQLYLQPSIGFNIPFSDDVKFSPILEFGVPMSEFSGYGVGLKSNYWQLLFELRIKVSKEK